MVVSLFAQSMSMSVKLCITVACRREVEKREGGGRGERANLGEGAKEDSRLYDQLPPALPVGVYMLRWARRVTRHERESGTGRRPLQRGRFEVQ